MSLSLKSVFPRLFALVLLVGCWSPLAHAADGDEALQLTTESEEAKSQITEGLFDIQNVHQSAAAEHFRNAISADPDYGLAKVLAASADLSLSSEESDHLSEEGFSQMSGVSSEEMLLALAVRAWDQGEFDKANVLFGALATLAPDDATIAFFEAQTAGPFSSAQRMEAMAKVVERFPDHAAAQNIAAYDAWQLDDRRGALEAVSRYLELAPDHPNAHDSYAEMMLNMGMMDQSIQHYRQAVSMDDGFWVGYQGLASALAFNGETDAARDALNKGAELAPNPNSRFNMRRGLAVTHLIDNDVDAAIDALEQIVEESAGMENARNARTLALYQLAGMKALEGNGTEAMALLDDAQATQPEGWDSYHNTVSAMVHVWSGNPAAARKAAGALDEEDHLLKGMIAYAEGNPEEAKKSLRMTGLQDPMARIYMAKIEAENGNGAAAQALVADIHRLDEMDMFNPIEPLAHMVEEDLE